MKKYILLSDRCDITIFWFSLQNGNICYPLLYCTMKILPVWVEMGVLSLTSVFDRRWNLGNHGPWVYFSCGHYPGVKVSQCSQPLNHSSSNEKLSDFSWWSTHFVTIGWLLLVMALCSHAYITGLILGLLLPLPFCVCIRLNLALIQIK